VSELTTTGIYLFIYLFNIRSGVARNFRQGVRQSVAFLSLHPVQLPYQVGRTIKKRHDISYRLNEPKIMYFPDRGAYAPYATCMATPLSIREHRYDTTRYDTRCYFNVRSKADMSQLNLPHGTDN